MKTYIQSRPVALYLGVFGMVLVFGLVARPLVETLAPDLSIIGIRVAINWLFVVLVIGLTTWLGFWKKVRLTVPISRGRYPYLLLLAGIVAIPFVAVVISASNPFTVPSFTLVEGKPLSPLGVAVVVVVGFALGAAISEEILYRGIVLRSLESYGRIPAALATGFMFGATHLSLLAVGSPPSEVLVVGVLSTVSGVGLAAITFKLGTLWPLVVWHLLQNSYPAFFTSEAQGVFIATNVVVSMAVALLGLWILWADRSEVRVDSGVTEATDSVSD